MGIAYSTDSSFTVSFYFCLYLFLFSLSVTYHHSN